MYYVYRLIAVFGALVANAGCSLRLRPLLLSLRLQGLIFQPIFQPGVGHLKFTLRIRCVCSTVRFDHEVDVLVPFDSAVFIAVTVRAH